MVEEIKLAQVMSGLVLLSAGFLTLVVFLLNSLFQPNPSTPIYVPFAIAVFSIIFIEGGLARVTWALNMKEEKLKYLRQKNIASQIASVIAVLSKYGSIATSAGLILFLIALFVIIGAVFLDQVQKQPLAISAEFYIQFFVYVIYFTIARQFILRAIKSSGKIVSIKTPSFKIENYSIKIDLNIRDKGLTSSGKYIVKIKFDELEEIKELNYIETESFLKYIVGPDINLQMQSSKDLYRYAKGSIPRPNTYIMPAGTAGKTLLLRGPNIFYLLGVGDQDCSELIRIFYSYKKRKPNLKLR